MNYESTTMEIETDGASALARLLRWEANPDAYDIRAVFGDQGPIAPGYRSFAECPAPWLLKEFKDPPAPCRQMLLFGGNGDDDGDLGTEVQAAPTIRREFDRLASDLGAA